jgi:hypothetical protein
MYTKLTPCDMKPDTDSMSGKMRHGKCTWNARRKREDAQSHGCGVSADNSFGNKFNERGGGVWALLVESSGIKVWYFDRAGVPGDIGRGNPKPDGWGIKPVMSFAPKKCNVKEAWKKMNIVRAGFRFRERVLLIFFVR